METSDIFGYNPPQHLALPGVFWIPTSVQTTEGFAEQGKLLIRYGYNPRGMIISYRRTDATHFYGCDWGADASARLKKAIRRDAIAKGSHVITDLAGRLFPNGEPRPRKEYIAVVKSPDPPRALIAARVAKGVRLRWREPISHKETAGYVVFRRIGDGPLERLTPAPVAACEFLDPSPPRRGRARYWVRAVERCGLYGAYSGMAWVDAASAGAEVADSYDVRGCNFVAPGERPTSDRRRVRIYVPVAGEYALWARCRAWRGPETLHVSIDDEPQPDARVEGVKWHWIKVAQRRFAVGEHAVEFSRETKYDIAEGNLLKNGGFEEGLKGWTYDEAVTSIDATRAHSGKQCVKLSGVLTRKKLFQIIPLRPKPEWSYRLSFWLRGKFTKSGAKRYHGPHPHTLGRIAVNIEPFPYPRGWTCDGNQFDDKRWHRIEVVVDSPADVRWRRVTAQPFWCPWYWGEQVGEVWIDDVEVVELGPRLRPAKVTKLLVTNLPGYRPAGYDGRGALRPPRAPRIAVADLRVTGRTRSSISLIWTASRPGARGFNLYVRAGRECTATKYFRADTVWCKTSATLRGLAGGRTYAIKVTALNEDGVEGPPASLTARTASAAAETHVMEAENAALIPPMQIQHSGGVTFVVTPADPKREELYDREGRGKPTGAARFEFTIKEGGAYLVWGRLFAPNGGSNSLWFSLDGGKEVCWSAPHASLGKWTWLQPSEGERYRLAPGRHVITIRTREAGTRLDRLVVTNDLRTAAPEPE